MREDDDKQGNIASEATRCVITVIVLMGVGVLLYYWRHALAPLFDRAYEWLGPETGNISALGIVAGGAAALGFGIAYPAVRDLNENNFLEKLGTCSDLEFIWRVVFGALGGFLILNSLLWFYLPFKPIISEEWPEAERNTRIALILIALIGGGLFKIVDAMETPRTRFYLAHAFALAVTLTVLGRWFEITPSEADHAYVAWIVVFALLWWQVWRAWQSDPEARIHNARVARAFAYLVTGYTVLALFLRALHHGWLYALLTIGDFAYPIVIAWLWVKLSVDPSAAKRTFFGLPFIRHRQNKAFAWLQAVNPAARGAPLRSAPAGDRPAASAERPPSLDG